MADSRVVADANLGSVARRLFGGLARFLSDATFRGLMETNGAIKL